MRSARVSSGLAMALALAAFAPLGLLRSGVADLCPGEDLACWVIIGRPCMTSQECVSTAGGSPSTVTSCTEDGLSKPVAYWKTLEGSSSWSECKRPPNVQTLGPCSRKALVCATARLYTSQANCENDLPCYTDVIEECAAEYGYYCQE